MRWTQFRWLDATTSKGVMNRQDGELCCCPNRSNIIFAAPPAIPSGMNKCTYICCLEAQKLCGASCCTEGQKCISGESKTNVTTTALPPAAGCSWHWLEIVPGAMTRSCLIDHLRVGGVFDCGYACRAFPLVPCQRSSSLHVIMYTGYRRWRTPGVLGGDTPCFLTVACFFAGCESVIFYLIVDDIGMPHSWTAALPSNECQEAQLSNTGLGQWMQKWLYILVGCCSSLSTWSF